MRIFHICNNEQTKNTLYNIFHWIESNPYHCLNSYGLKKYNISHMKLMYFTNNPLTTSTSDTFQHTQKPNTCIHTLNLILYCFHWTHPMTALEHCQLVTQHCFLLSPPTLPWSSFSASFSCSETISLLEFRSAEELKRFLCVLLVSGTCWSETPFQVRSVAC